MQPNRKKNKDQRRTRSKRKTVSVSKHQQRRPNHKVAFYIRDKWQSDNKYDPAAIIV